MNYDEQIFLLKAIASQAKRLLLSEEIPDATPEVMDLCELIEKYEAAYSEIEPKLRLYGKKSWYAPLGGKGQVAELREILALSGD